MTPNPVENTATRLRTLARPKADMHLEIDRTNIRSARLVQSAPPGSLADGQVVLRLERAALTSNNVTYAVAGDMLDYWGFFPTQAGWGRLPVMGFGVVTASAHPQVAVGSRYFGFYPLGDHHVVQASPSRNGFIDAGPHRGQHAMTYRSFERTDGITDDDAAERTLVFRGLFVTSYLIDDFLREHDMFGADRVIVTSASSKTSVALAHCLHRDSRVRVTGLTASANADFARGVGEYDDVVTYDDIATLADGTTSVLVDMAGNTTVVAAVHTALAGSVTHSCSVGATHWDAPRHDGAIPPPRPEFFFAPSQLAARGKDIGTDELQRRMTEALATFAESSRQWLTIDHTVGGSAVADLYTAMASGTVDPAVGHIVAFA